MLSRSGSGEYDAEKWSDEEESAAAIGELAGQLEEDFFPEGG